MTTPTNTAGGDPVFRLKSLADLRALLYFITPLAFTWLTNNGTLDHERAALWVAFVLAILSPVLAAANVPAADRWRSYVHLVLGAVQTLVVGLHLFTDNQVSPVIAIVAVILQSLIASLNTPNTASIVAAVKVDHEATDPRA